MKLGIGALIGDGLCKMGLHKWRAYPPHTTKNKRTRQYGCGRMFCCYGKTVTEYLKDGKVVNTDIMIDPEWDNM